MGKENWLGQNKLFDKGKSPSKNILISHLNKKVGGVVLTVLVSIILLVVIILPVSYALFRGTKEASGSVSVPDNDYCLNNGFTKLSDCILVTENYAKSVNEAKSYIATKGTGDFSKIAPTVTYKEVAESVTDSNGLISTSTHFTLGKGYIFDSLTGMFTLTDYVDADLTDSYLNYYTCGATQGTFASCSTMYQIKKYVVSTETDGRIIYKITSAVRHDYKAIDALDSEIGLYSSPDDIGISYYYRGNVKNNYVSFAGYIWRIIRENGNGSVRLIYSGPSVSSTGEELSVANNSFNSKYWDPTYAGYKYNENFYLNTSDNPSAMYNNFKENVSYSFGSNYTFDATTNRFKLSGNIISGTWKDVYQQAITKYPYTCFGTSSTANCVVMIKMLDYISPYSASVQLISYSSKDYNSTLLNTTDSTIKAQLDSWYETNILNKKDANGKLYTNYISDEVFCNDRMLSDETPTGNLNGTGYLLAPNTYYDAYKRVVDKMNPTLKCGQASDKFSVSSTKGNASLKYPIGLLSIDEVSMAGATSNSVNTKYYLYTEQNYWTMSPAVFSAAAAHNFAFFVKADGSMARTWATNKFGIRPVINLSSNVLISGGNGTAERPYTLKLT